MNKRVKSPFRGGVQDCTSPGIVGMTGWGTEPPGPGGGDGVEQVDSELISGSRLEENIFLQNGYLGGETLGSTSYQISVGDWSTHQTVQSSSNNMVWTSPPATNHNGHIVWSNETAALEEAVQQQDGWPPSELPLDSLEPDWSSQGGNVEVDQTPLQNQLRKNKESLELKLQLRRPMTALVEQGIMPQYKTSPSLHEQRTKLERAQMGDRLRQKIASRPDRQELVHRHILEDVRPDVDPSLCSRQRQLKRAKLADSLATQLSHRPGPLELIQKNILHTDDPVEDLVKQGTIEFTPTALGTPQGTPSKTGARSPIMEESLSSFCEEDSNDTVPSPSMLLTTVTAITKVVTTPQTSAPLFNASNIQLPDLAALTASTVTTKAVSVVSRVEPTTFAAMIPSGSSSYSFSNQINNITGDSGLGCSGAGQTSSVMANPSQQQQNKNIRSESLGDINTSLSSPDLQLFARSCSFASSCGTAGDLDTASIISGFSETADSVISTADSVLTAAGVSPVHRVSTPVICAAAQPLTSLRPVTSTPFSTLSELNGPSLQREAPGKDRKKIKMKKPSTAPKPRTIKFHEYKGPETSLKRKIDEKGDGKGDRKGSGSETAYDLLLKQQQVFLQWQLENQNKYPQILLPATSRSSLMSLGSSSSPSLIGSSSVSLNSSSQTSSCAPSPGSSRPSTPRSNTPIRSLILTPQDVNHATSLLNRLDDMKVTELKMELKKRGLVVSGPKPILVDRLRPVLQDIIAAGRKQFQQPYKQISIPKGGLIILKPSPNSQLLTRQEQTTDNQQQQLILQQQQPQGATAVFANSIMSPSPATVYANNILSPCQTPGPGPGTPQSMHEGTPDLSEDSPMTPVSQLGANTIRERESSTPFSPVSVRSPANSLIDDGSQGSPHPQLVHSNSMDLDLNLSLMEMETTTKTANLNTMTVPPPPPPPPPPAASGGGAGSVSGGEVAVTMQHQKISPAPLPAPPSAVGSLEQQQSIQPVIQQFVPPQKTNQQIMFTKQQLEFNLAGGNNSTGPAGRSINGQENYAKPTGPVRAGPKGQFIWPPVSVQSSMSGGIVTIRAARSTNSNTNTITTSSVQQPYQQQLQHADEQMSSSTPVAQLAAVFSINSAAPSPSLHQSSFHQSSLHQSSSAPNLKAAGLAGSEAPATTKISLSSILPFSTSDVNGSTLGTGLKLTRSGSIQLTPGGFQFGAANVNNLPPNIRLPQEPIPVSELGDMVTTNNTYSSSVVSQHPPQLPATLPVATTSTAIGINPLQNQLPTTLPVIQQQQQQTSFATNMHVMHSRSLTNNAVSIDQNGFNNGTVTAVGGVGGGSVIVLPPLSAASVTVMNSSMTAQPSMATSDNTVLVPSATLQSLGFHVTPHPPTSQQQQLHTDNTQQTYSLIQQPQTSVINMPQATYSSNTNSGVLNHPIYSVVPSNSSDSISSSNNARGEDIEMSPPPQLSHTTAVVNGVGSQQQQANLLAVLEQQQQQPQLQPQSTQDIINQQQKQIEELTKALERSRQILADTQNQQQASGKVHLSRNLQKRQLTNQITQLQNQIVSKAQQQKAVVSAAIQHNTLNQRSGEEMLSEEALNQSMDEFLDSILKNGFSDSSSDQNITGIPPPPPPPANTSSSTLTTSTTPTRPSKDGVTTPPMLKAHATASPGAEFSVQLPQLLDFSDLGFDLGQLTDLGGCWPPGSAVTLNGVGGESSNIVMAGNNGSRDWLDGKGSVGRGLGLGLGAGVDEESMDVDMDVADWLDSLIPPVNNSGSSGM